MLGNGYKERLANAQSSVSSLLLNLSKQPGANSPQQQQALEKQLQQLQNMTEDNEPDLEPPFKHSFQPKLMTLASTAASGAPTLPPVPAPVLESNSFSRHGYQRKNQPQQQSHPRTSRLPNAGLNFGRLSDQFPELGASESSSSATTARLQARASLEDFSAFGVVGGPRSASTGSRWDTPNSNSNSFYDANSVSNSPNVAEMSFAAVIRSGSNNRNNNVSKNGNADAHAQAHADLTALASLLEAVVVIQRAMRRFLVRKQARTNKASRGDAVARGTPDRRQGQPVVLAINTKNKDSNNDKFDMESLQQTCIRQSAEIDQLKELVTRMLLEAEEDRRKLRQRDGQIEELMKLQQQQKLSQSTSLASGFDVSSTAKASASTRFNNKLVLGQSGNVAPSATVPSFNTFGLSGDEASVTAALEHMADDLYESSLSYAQNVGGPAPLHPLSLPSRSNSITSLQSQSHLQSLSLKINPPTHTQSLYQQQYHGLMDMVDSPSSDFAPQDLPTPTSAFGTATSATAGRQGGYGSQNAFPMLNHRNSGSFSTTSSVRGGAGNGGGSAFDSPAIEQPGAYPWNAPGSLSHSQSWADDIATGYGYESSIPSPGQYQHATMGHSGAFDPNFLNQQYSHGGQQQQQQQQATQQQQYQGLPPHRNSYRRHSDKPVHLDYQMCVDRILQATDQQASIHLQQKLKTSPPEQKIQIIDAILGQAYPLMSNRFGNFLIQRCFEFGSPQQIDALAQAMRGNILTLACDPFGCHVVQKALDNVEEDCKARIVTEMFRRIRETIVHRYACHVWQKVFEIRWTDAPPAVMTYVNNAVSGRWASVAVDETGSLVVQNIFENCAEHDKRPVLNEILQSVTTIAKGQWGNWVIQHILEHGAPADRATVTQKVLEDAVNLSLDQYASKVVEKTLRMAAMHSSAVSASSLAAGANGVSVDKNSSNGTVNNNFAHGEDANAGPPTVAINGTTIRLTQEEVMSNYIQIVCDGVQDRPRIPLIDIAADQYGNYIVQYILTNAGPQHRETCAALIKRHMVSLRGSKYGQKVAFMVERWRGSPFSGNGSNSGGGGGNGNGREPGQGGSSGSYGSKPGSGSGLEGGNGGGGGRRRW